MKTPTNINAGECSPASPCSPIRVAYSREEIEAKLKEWMIAEFGHPRDYLTEPDAKERWYRDFGLMYHFICDHFPVANAQVERP
jgi:hypothetical protein